jgi:hypothetical protein
MPRVKSLVWALVQGHRILQWSRRQGVLEPACDSGNLLGALPALQVRQVRFDAASRLAMPETRSHRAATIGGASGKRVPPS